MILLIIQTTTVNKTYADGKDEAAVKGNVFVLC